MVVSPKEAEVCRVIYSWQLSLVKKKSIGAWAVEGGGEGKGARRVIFYGIFTPSPSAQRQTRRVVAAEKQGWEGAFQTGRHSCTPPKLHRLAQEKCQAITGSKFVPAEPNQLLREGRGCSATPAAGCAKSTSWVPTAAAQQFLPRGTIILGHSGTAPLLPSQPTAL